MNNSDKQANTIDENMELNDKQEDINYNGTVKLIKKRSILVIALIIVLCLFAWVYTTLIGIIPESKRTSYTPTTVKISTYTDNLEYKPTYISTDLGNKTATFSIDLSNGIVSEIGNSIGSSNIKYTDAEMKLTTEIVITSTVPTNMGFKEDINKALSKNNNKLIVLEDAEGRTVERAVTKLYDIGYLVVIQTAETPETKTFAALMLDTVKDCMLYSDNKEIDQKDKKLILEIDGLGAFDFNSLIQFKSNVAIETEDSTKIKFYSNEEYITFENYNDTYKFEVIEGWNNLYTEKNSNKLGIQTNKGFYTIETSSDSIKNDMISLLGVKKEDAKIQTIFE